MSNISTCEAVELVRNAIDLHRISFAEFADKVTKTTRIQGEWVDEIPVFEPGDDYGQYTWNKCERI